MQVKLVDVHRAESRLLCHRPVHFAEALTITSHKRTNFTATSKSDDATKPRPGTPLSPRHGSMHVSVVSSIHRFHGYDVNSLPPIKPEALRVSLAPCELRLEALKARIATSIHKFELEALTTTAAVTATCIWQKRRTDEQSGLPAHRSVAL